MRCHRILSLPIDHCSLCSGAVPSNAPRRELKLQGCRNTKEMDTLGINGQGQQNADNPWTTSSNHLVANWEVSQRLSRDEYTVTTLGM